MRTSAAVKLTHVVIRSSSTLLALLLPRESGHLCVGARPHQVLVELPAQHLCPLRTRHTSYTIMHQLYACLYQSSNRDGRSVFQEVGRESKILMTSQKRTLGH